MNIELKKIKHAPSLSEETNAYTAEIWVDGKKAGTTKNEGRGGCDRIEPHALAQQIDAYAKTLPGITYLGQTFPQDADCVLHDLLNAHLETADVKRKLARKTLFVADGKLWGVKATPAIVRGKYPGATILNELPLPEAVKLYLVHTEPQVAASEQVSA